MQKRNTLSRLMLIMTFVFALVFTSVAPTMTVEAKTSVKYKIKKYNKTKTYKYKKAQIKDVEYYKLVVVSGKSKAVKKINKTLKADCTKALKKMPAGYAKKDVKKGRSETYYNVYDATVEYNKKGIFSVVETYQWYQGGVADYGSTNYVFSIKSGKKLKLTDVCKESNKALTKKIKKLLKYKYEGCPFDSSFNKISADKADFFIDKKGNAVVEFDKYEIAPGFCGSFSIILPTKYTTEEEKNYKH